MDATTEKAIAQYHSHLASMRKYINRVNAEKRAGQPPKARGRPRKYFDPPYPPTPEGFVVVAVAKNEV
jgi:hypothetical protein